MRHRIKKTYSVRESNVSCAEKLKQKSHLLRSDKRTCFYKNKLNKSFFRKTQAAGRVVEKFGSDPRQEFCLNHKKSRIVGKIIPLGLPAMASLALVGLIGMMIFPTQISEVSATEGDTENLIDTQALTVPEKGVALSIDTAMDNNTITQPVSSSGGAQYISINFTVGANNVDQYQVFVQADSTLLTGATPNNPDVISSIATATAANGIGAMQWGYAVAKSHNADPASLTYQAIQSTVGIAADTVKKSDGSQLTNVTQPYTLAFAANMEGAKADHYKSNITLSVATDAKEVVNLSSLPTMQDMTWRVCDAALIGDTARVKDARDSKYYWIAKLADGNCWMTQNLALDLNGRTLTSADSDIPETVGSWKSTTGASGFWSGSQNTANLVKYYNPGVYALSNPTSIKKCDLTAGSALSGCADVWKNVQSLTPSDNPNFYKDMGNQVVTNKEYDAHYLSGNYYSWGATTANEAQNISDKASASRSICPRGWRLPIGNNKTSSKSFGFLLSQYNLQSTLSSGQYDIRLAPLFFVYSGYMYHGTMTEAGSRGDYWSSDSAVSDIISYVLSFSSSVNPTAQNGGYGNRYDGLSVRCVAR